MTAASFHVRQRSDHLLEEVVKEEEREEGKGW